MKGIAPTQTVDEYLEAIPTEQAVVLKKLRDLIRSTIPDAVESISYGVPTYKLNGRPVVYFGNAKTHFALYGIMGDAREMYKLELAGYSMSKGTIRFPFDRPIPAGLIKKLVKAALKDNEVKASTKKNRENKIVMP